MSYQQTSKNAALQAIFERIRFDLLQPVTVDHRTENPRVGGSNPPLGTNKINTLCPIPPLFHVPAVAREFPSFTMIPFDSPQLYAT
jgi:hypothetical protein